MKAKLILILGLAAAFLLPFVTTGTSYASTRVAYNGDLTWYLQDAPAFGWSTQGPDHHVLLRQNPSTIHMVSLGNPRYGKVYMKTLSGKCLYISNKLFLTEESTACGTLQKDEEFTLYIGNKPGQYLILGDASGQYLGTYGPPFDGNKVRAHSPQTGFYRGWEEFPQSVKLPALPHSAIPKS